MKIPERCEQRTTDTKIVLEENQSKITFHNKRHQEVKKIRIDGCVITDGQRCDYLIIDNTSKEYFVELKGSDVDHAINQIEETIRQVSQNHQKHTKHCFIISSRCPLLTTKIQALKRKFKDHYNAHLTIKNRHYEFDL